MTDVNDDPKSIEEKRIISLKNYANACYLLYGLGLFTLGLTSLVSLAMCYVKRQKDPSAWVSTHFTWIIQSFWYFACLFVVGYGLLITKAPTLPLIGLLILVVNGGWALYRLMKGWLALANDLKMFDQ